MASGTDQENHGRMRHKADKTSELFHIAGMRLPVNVSRRQRKAGIYRANDSVYAIRRLQIPSVTIR